MQETERYKKMIRQHMDLQTVQRRLERGFYKGSTNKLFRDLLLLFNNAVVFFRNSSPEHTAALQLRQLVTDHIIAARPKSMPPKSDPDRIRPGPRPDKAPAPPPPIAVCRRRVEKNQQQQQQQQQRSRLRSSNDDDNNKVLMEKKCLDKKQVGVKEKVDLSRRSGSGTNNKVRNVITNHSGTKNKGRNVIKKHSEDDDEVDDVDDELEIRLRKRKNESLKKKNIGTGSGYLKRMKQKSPPKEAEEDSTDHDETSSSSEEENGREKRRKGGSGGSKRGRPPKRSPGRTDSAGKFAKRRREGRDRPPAVAESGQGRKRPRR